MLVLGRAEELGLVAEPVPVLAVVPERGLEPVEEPERGPVRVAVPESVLVLAVVPGLVLAVELGPERGPVAGPARAIAVRGQVRASVLGT